MYTIKKDTPITSEVISAAIKHNESYRAYYTALKEYYIGRHPILRRNKVSSLKNNKVVTNHAKYITNINTGYLIGKPVEYQSEVPIDKILDQYKQQRISAVDSQIGKDMSIFGKAYDYTYAVDNNVRTKKLDPRNCIVVYDDTMDHEKLFAITYSSVKIAAKGAGSEYFDVKVIDNEKTTEYDKDLKPIEDKIVDHNFGAVPVIEYINNDDELGDYEDVISLIDAYNTLQSDRINDKEQLVEAILVLYGVSLTTEHIEQVKDNRILALKKDAKAEYLIKTLQEADVDVLRARIEADIHKISMTPNLSDENFVGNSSGVAIRYKLFAFEQNIQNKEVFLEKGLLERFKLYSTYLNKLNNASPLVEPYQVDAIFKRAMPQNDLEISQMISTLDGMVGREKLVGQLSFIENAKEEVELARKESMERAKTLAKSFGTPKPSNENPEDESFA